MAKVKKRPAVTGVRNVKAGKRSKQPARAPVTKRQVTKGAAKAKRVVTAPKAERKVAVRELDPRQKCGDGTTVQLLYRVDEMVDGRATAHLVFFDRHGWYCEHGRACPAVAHARKRNGHIARVS